MAGLRQRIGDRIDGAEHVEIHETVVERGDQRVRHRVREPHQIAVAARRIDHDEVVVGLGDGDFVDEALKLGIFILVVADAIAARDKAMRRDVEVEPVAPAPRAAVLDVMREALLPGIEIDGGDALAGLHQGNRDMDGERRFARAAFFIADHDDVGRLVRVLVRLDQHHAALAPYASTRALMNFPPKEVDLSIANSGCGDWASGRGAIVPITLTLAPISIRRDARHSIHVFGFLFGFAVR